MLGVEPGVSVVRIGQLAGIDSGAVSRSLYTLSERGLIHTYIDVAERRRRILSISEAG